MGFPVLLLWVILAAIGLGVFALLTVRNGRPGAVHGLPALLGAVLSYGLVSAAIGWMEQVWSLSSGGFWLALAFGSAGIVGIAYSSRRAFSPISSQ